MFYGISNCCCWIHSFSNYKIGHEERSLIQDLTDGNLASSQLKALTDQPVHANKEKSEALIKTEELNSQQLTLEYKERRLDQERELFVRQQRLLQDELETRTREIMTIRREKTSRVLELEELEENIEAMSPAASRLLKSGMTLTQIYSQYVSISEQMLFEEEENKKLNNYIDQILQEHEDRAPTIARQREDSILKEKKEKEAALDSQIQALQGQLAELRAQNVRLSTHNEYADSKEKPLQGNLESCKKQLNALEDKNKIYACTIAKHEQSIAVLRDEAMNAQQLLASAEIKVSMLQEEKQLLQDLEKSLTVERNALFA
ncbi:nucleoprotein TPR-like isoform X3 [Daphnia pulicaria]|uniref:nucleoprotein TPR-like isoform X3 n=2 Tax=Daphnia pulicaria TaxID=35523 RepID=UPI001EEB986C|nr:nucleoprotein TPR-like isoform X3 [Daphnia pulicaria]